MSVRPHPPKDWPDASVRDRLAQQLLRQLIHVSPGSEAELRGSLASRTSDYYSDIDIFWEIPDVSFDDAIADLPRSLAAVGQVESLRSDPDFQRSERRRLLFIQLSDVPLFWRIDLEIFARSINRDSNYDCGNLRARGDHWSLSHSSLMNCVAAIKAMARSNETAARELLSRAFSRVNLPPPAPRISVKRQIRLLAEDIAKRDADLADLAERVLLLNRDFLEYTTRWNGVP
jgi:hypothetical protein